MHSQPRAFSVFAGGPFLQMLRQAHLSDEGLNLVYRRIPEIAAVGALVPFLLIAPLLVFSTRLAHVRREGLTEHGALAASYVRDFDRKWLRGAIPANQPLIGSPDIQSLADLATSLEVVKGMNIVMVSRLTVISVVAYTLAPVVPLVLTMMPLQELMTTLLRILF